jgi:hypothetical protein
MNLISAEMQVYVAEFEIVERIERARSYHGNARPVRTRRTRRPRVPWRAYA